MREPRRLSRLVVAMFAVFSLVAASTPASSNVISGVHISAKKKVLAKEVKAAKAAVTKAEKVLKSKQKSLDKATKALGKAKKNLDTAKAKAGLPPSALVPVKGTSKVMKAVNTAQRRYNLAAALVDTRTRARDKAQADLTNAQAKYAWLTSDLTAMDCGAGTQVTAANGAVETVNECGIVYLINDGDTVWVKTTKNSIVEVRNIGLQTPEMKKQTGFPEQCGATAAKKNMLAMLTPEVSVVQLRSITGKSNNWLKNDPRAERSIYALNPVTGLFDIDVQAEQMKAGLSFYWPSAAEWTHNKEYLGYLLEARAAQKGIWNPNFCGTVAGAAPSMFLNANSPSIGLDVEPAIGEYVLLKNETATELDLSGWSLRDGSLDFFSIGNEWQFDKSQFPAGTKIAPGAVMTVYLSNPKNYTIADSANEKVYFTWRSPSAQIANGCLNGSTTPCDSTAFEKAHGDGVYLLDPKGNVRASMLSVCSTTQYACDKPAWVTELQTSNAAHIIPWPVSLNLLINDSTSNRNPDRYNPKVTLASTNSVDANVIALNALGFNATKGADDIDGPLAAGKAAKVYLTGGSEITSGTRTPIAVLPANTTRTALTVHGASGFNTLPTITGMTEANARAALTNAGFTIGTVSTAPGALPVGAVQPGGTQRLAVGTAISFTVNQ